MSEEGEENESTEDNEEDTIRHAKDKVEETVGEATDTVRNVAVNVLDRSKDHLSMAGKMASKLGMSGFSKSILTGAVEEHLSNVRKDQLHTVLRNNQSISELIDEDEPPQELINAIEKLSTFITRQDMVVLIDKAITPQVIKQGLKEADPELYRMIIQGNVDKEEENDYSMFANPGQGEKWFHRQTREVKVKFMRIILKKTFDDLKEVEDVQGMKGLVKLAEKTGQNDIAIDIKQYVKAIYG